MIVYKYDVLWAGDFSYKKNMLTWLEYLLNVYLIII